MKRYLTAVLLLALALPFSACAQWYLFPGGRPAADSTAVAGTPDSTVVFTAVTDSTVVVSAVPDSIAQQLAAADSISLPVTRVTLILPLKSAETPNSNFLDFYCGVLAAADALSSNGERFRISVFDSTVELPYTSHLDSSNLVIGPVGMEDVIRIVPRMRGNIIGTEVTNG